MLPTDVLTAAGCDAEVMLPCSNSQSIWRSRPAPQRYWS